jgi:hypothetical protein
MNYKNKAASSTIFGFFGSLGRDIYKGAKGASGIIFYLVLVIAGVFLPSIVVYYFVTSIRKDNLLRLVGKTVLFAVSLVPLYWLSCIAIVLIGVIISMFKNGPFVEGPSVVPGVFFDLHFYTSITLGLFTGLISVFVKIRENKIIISNNTKLHRQMTIEIEEECASLDNKYSHINKEKCTDFLNDSLDQLKFMFKYL